METEERRQNKRKEREGRTGKAKERHGNRKLFLFYVKQGDVST